MVDEAPHTWWISVSPGNSTRQDKFFHALTALAARHLEFAGRRWEQDDWRAFLVSGHTRATLGDAVLEVGLEGELVILRESTAQMDRDRKASLIEYTIAYLVQNGVQIPARPDDEIPAWVKE